MRKATLTDLPLLVGLMRISYAEAGSALQVEQSGVGAYPGRELLALALPTHEC